MVVVDGGGALLPGLTSTPSEAQVGRAGVVAAAFEMGGIDAMALSPDDWGLGTEAVMALVSTHHLPVLAANLTCDGEAPFPASVVVERGGHRVGIVGITTEPGQGCEASLPAPALRAALAALGTVDLTVALLGTEKSATAKLLSHVEGIDIAFDAEGTRQDLVPDRQSNTWVYGTGRRGQRVGLTTVRFTQGGASFLPVDWATHQQRAVDRAQRRVDSLKARVAQTDGNPKYQRMYDKALAELADGTTLLSLGDAPHHTLSTEHAMLDDKVTDEPEAAALVAAFLRKETESTFGHEPIALLPRVAPTPSPFAGAQTCKGCHPSQHQTWEVTAHAKAWTTLVQDDHAADPSCVSCHATGVGAPGGPAGPAEILGLRDVQCEACHGAAAAHVAAPTDSAHKPTRQPAQSVCTTCHDGERDMGRFDYPSYLPRVSHGATSTP